MIDKRQKIPYNNSEIYFSEIKFSNIIEGDTHVYRKGRRAGALKAIFRQRNKARFTALWQKEGW